MSKSYLLMVLGTLLVGGIAGGLSACTTRTAAASQGEEVLPSKQGVLPTAAEVAPAPTLPPVPATQVIGNALYIEANGCESRAQHLDLGIPDASRLDTSHQGIVPGIEFQETTHVGRAGVRNVAFNGSSLSFDMFAEGAGTIQGGGQIELPFGVRINNPVPRTCVGAAGASYGLKVTAFYR